MTARITNTSQLIAAKVAGLAYVLIIILAILKLIFVGSGLIVSGNDAAMIPALALLSLLEGWISDTFVDRPGSLSMSTLLPGVARASSRVLLACVVQGVAAGVIALVTRERPRWLPILGLATTAFLIGLFLFFE